MRQVWVAPQETLEDSCPYRTSGRDGVFYFVENALHFPQNKKPSGQNDSIPGRMRKAALHAAQE